MLTPKAQAFNQSAIDSLRTKVRAARVKMYEKAQYSSGHEKTQQEQYACMVLAKEFEKNDWTLSADAISRIHKETYGSTGQNAGKLVWIAQNKSDRMPGFVPLALLQNAEYHDWIIMSVGAKGNVHYTAIQVPDYEAFYGENWRDNVTRPASGRGRKQKVKPEAAATESDTAVPALPAPLSQEEILAAIGEQYPDAPQATTESEATATEEVVVVQEQATEPQAIVEEVVVEEPKKLSKNERRRLARQKAAAAA